MIEGCYDTEPLWSQGTISIEVSKGERTDFYSEYSLDILGPFTVIILSATATLTYIVGSFDLMSIKILLWKIMTCNFVVVAKCKKLGLLIG